MDATEEPRWLDVEESQAWRALAKTLVRLPAALDAQLRRDAGIGHFEYDVLALLSETPGCTLRMSELATLAGGSLPRLSQVVARLEQRGWVRRAPDSADGRYTLATLTDQGQAKVTEAAPRHARAGTPVTGIRRHCSTTGPDCGSRSTGAGVENLTAERRMP